MNRLRYEDTYGIGYNDVDLLCGATASFDHSSGISYRCNDCGAVVGSIGMPRECKELYDMEKVVNRLKGRRSA